MNFRIAVVTPGYPQLKPEFEVKWLKCFVKPSLTNLLYKRLHINCLFSNPFIKCITQVDKVYICIFCPDALT